MAIVVQYTTQVSVEEYDEVIARLEFHDDPPEGLIVHTAAVNKYGQMRIFDVWRSREAYERFDEGRLRPAIAEVVGLEGELSIGLQIHDLHSLVRPEEASSSGWPLGDPLQE